jgi:DNA-binding NarL/FixJ family response regulator
MSDAAEPARAGVSYRVVFAHADDPQRTERVQAVASQDDLVVVGEAPDGERAAGMVEELVPEVVVVDLDLPGLPVVELVRELNHRLPAVRVAVRGDDDDAAYECVRVGAAAAVSAEVAPQELPEIIRRVVRGESLLSPGCAQRLSDELEALVADPSRLVARTPQLTPTEREVLRRLASGATPHEIAVRHEVTPRMVNLHAGLAVAKLQRAHHQHRQLG